MHALVPLLIHYRYLILFPVAALEGPIVSFVVGTLVAAGYFDPLPAYGILVLGDLIPDTAYYYLGRYGGQALMGKFAPKIGVKEGHFDVVRALWNDHPGKTMFFSKLAYGLSTPFLVSAGFVGMPLSQFLRYALPVTFAQYAILMALGYFFGNSFKLVSNALTDVELLIAAAVVVGVGYNLMTRFMRTKLLDEERRKEAEKERQSQDQLNQH